MNYGKLLYIIGASAALYFVLTSLYDSQFKDDWESEDWWFI